MAMECVCRRERVSCYMCKLSERCPKDPRHVESLEEVGATHVENNDKALEEDVGSPRE